MTSSRTHNGFSLVELLVVIVVLGVLATVTVFAVRGVADRGEDAACDAEARTISIAADLYMAQESVELLPATGTGDDRFEQTLVDVGFLKSTSRSYDLAADGTVSADGEPCV